MQIYLVGGAVRDELLGRAVTERDWLVVGATEPELTAQGYQRVGKDFPVFLHPETHEEYALARTERKTGPGYHGFAVDASATVTLEDDLLRRDLTINAIARDSANRLIDPFDGQRDLRRRLLRHVSPAFAEDPVRILRIARFAARYASLGFKVADETQALMRQMVDADEVDALVPERVWQEWVRALGEDNPEQFIGVLRRCGALARVLPEIDRLFGVPQTACYHPEIDTGVHTLMCLELAAHHRSDSETRFAVLVHDLGKGVTPVADWPQHAGHEEAGAELLESLCSRLKIPNDYKALGRLVAQYHTHCHRALELRPGTVLKLLQGVDALRRPQRFEQFLQACEFDARGRLGMRQRDYPQSRFLAEARVAAAGVDVKSLVASGLIGEGLVNTIRQQRIAAIASLDKP